MLATGSEPWRLGAAIGLPVSLSLSGSYRARYETLDDQFRAGLHGGDQVLAQRLTLLASARFARVTLAGEMLDARAALNDSGSMIDPTIVNTWELLQGYVALDLAPSTGERGGSSVLRLGRITLDVGSRRLIARNSFRNTINNFTGADWLWQRDGRTLRVFYALPVDRQPNTRARLLDNAAALDDEDFGSRLFGVYYAPATLPWGDRGEIYLFGLNENDRANRPTRDRDLVTPGLRVYRPAQAGRIDYQIESVFQFGTSRASTAATDSRDLDHFAHFQHAELGYTFQAPWTPRLLLQYDHARGDGDPADAHNHRFDTLYGARRFDFGPSGIYGPFVRGNLRSPGFRLELKPAVRIDAMLTWRDFSLANRRDGWIAAGVVDPAGDSGRHLGSQVELQLRWSAIPGNLDVEAGFAQLFAGRVPHEAPNATGGGDPGYFYSQATLSF